MRMLGMWGRMCRLCDLMDGLDEGRGEGGIESSLRIKNGAAFWRCGLSRNYET